jgi:hypothetical protein
MKRHAVPLGVFLYRSSGCRAVNLEATQLISEDLNCRRRDALLMDPRVTSTLRVVNWGSLTDAQVGGHVDIHNLKSVGLYDGKCKVVPVL